MNVLIATFLAPVSPSGVITYCRTLVSDLANAGVGVQTVDASSTPFIWRKCMGVLKRLMRPLGGAFHVVYDEFAYFTGLYLAARKYRRAGINLIHAQDVRSGVAVYLALGRRVPVMLTCHFNDDPVRELVDQFSLKPGFVKQLTAWYTYLFSHVHHYVFVSNYAYTKSKHLLPADINKRILRNTVRLNAPTRTNRSGDHDGTRLIISNVGHVDERKNQQLLLQIAHELLSRKITDFTVWLIGDGPKRADYEQEAKKLGLTDHVTFYGQHAAPWELVARSDLYIHTALNDNCPYTLVEAFAVGTPVLALPVGGIPEMLPDGFGALHGTSIAELADEVARYFDSEERQKLVDAQAANAVVAFNHHANVEKLLSFYRQTAGVSSATVAHPAPAL